MKQLNWYQIFGAENIPDGKTVEPTDDVELWQKCGNTKTKYTSLAEILADSATLSALMASDNAADYLVRSTTFTSICADSSAMTAIGANNYCADILIDDSTWFAAILDSAYFESVLNGSVPAGGTAILTYNGFNTSSPRDTDINKVFDGNTTTETYDIFCTQLGIGYDFATPVKILAFKYYYTTGTYTGGNPTIFSSGHNFAIRQSDDGSNWTEIESFTGNSCVWWNKPIALSNSEAHRYYDIRTKNRNLIYGFGHDVNFTAIREVQFYYRKDV